MCLILIVILMALMPVSPLMWLMLRNYSVMQIDYTPENFLLLFRFVPLVALFFFFALLTGAVALRNLVVGGSTVRAAPASCQAIYSNDMCERVHQVCFVKVYAEPHCLFIHFHFGVCLCV